MLLLTQENFEMWFEKGVTWSVTQQYDQKSWLPHLSLVKEGFYVRNETVAQIHRTIEQLGLEGTVKII